MTGRGSNKIGAAAQQPGSLSKAELRRRAAQSARDKSLSQMAAVRSIPKGPAKKKEEMFTRGALKSMQFAPRGHKYYDAFVQTCDSAVVSATTGPATCITGMSTDVVPGIMKHTYTFPGTSETLDTNATLIIFNPGSSTNVVAKVYRLAPTGPDNLVGIHVTSLQCVAFDELGPALSQFGDFQADNLDGHASETNTNPSRRTESIPLRGSVRIRNISEALAVGGSVKTLRYNGSISMGADQSGTFDSVSAPPDVRMWASLCQMIRDAGRTHTLSGHSLMETHQINTHPADFVRSMTFSPDITFDEAIRFPRYNSVLMLIDDFRSASSATQFNNTYELSFRVHRAARFSMGSILHGLQRELKVMSETIKAAHQQEHNNDKLSKVPGGR